MPVGLHGRSTHCELAFELFFLRRLGTSTTCDNSGNMLATKKLFPYQTFQGDHVVEPSDNEDDSSEDEEDVTNSLFCMAVGMDPDVLQEQRQNTALKEISKRVTQLDPELVATLPPHYRWLVDSFAAVAVENPLVFETATNHELILDEFKEKPRCPDASAGVADIQKLGKFWKAGTYGEITCPAMDIIGVRLFDAVGV